MKANTKKRCIRRHEVELRTARRRLTRTREKATQKSVLISKQLTSGANLTDGVIIGECIIHAGRIAAMYGKVSLITSKGVDNCVSVCLCVRALKGKRLELSTPHLVDIHVQRIAIAWHALTLRSKGQRSRSRSYQMRCRIGAITLYGTRRTRSYRLWRSWGPSVFGPVRLL